MGQIVRIFAPNSDLLLERIKRLFRPLIASLTLLHVFPFNSQTSMLWTTDQLHFDGVPYVK